MIQKIIVTLTEKEKDAISIISRASCNDISCKNCPFALEDVNKCFRGLAQMIEERVNNEKS